MRFICYGPYEIPRNRTNINSHKESLKQFWEDLDDRESRLSNACGVYIFCLRKPGAKTPLPYYVGKAEKQSFEKEVFSHHKLTKYNNILNENKGTPLLYLMARVSARDRFSRPSKNIYPGVRFLEQYLIHFGVWANENFQNEKGTRMANDLEVKGFFNDTSIKSGAPKELLQIFRIKRPR